MIKNKTELGNLLLQSVKEMQSGDKARNTIVAVSYIVQARQNIGLSQSGFATLLGVSTRTLQDWEQGRRTPSGAAQTLIKVANKHPNALLDI